MNMRTKSTVPKTFEIAPTLHQNIHQHHEKEKEADAFSFLN
jgi:hypothetical protein